jgi:hypothetical protein
VKHIGHQLGFVMALALCSVAHAGLPPLDAGMVDVDAGVVDAGPDPCAPTCDGDTLRYCDGSTLTDLDCTSIGRCGLLSTAWGFDCIAREGAACDPGYAFGASRCDADAQLVCVSGTCHTGTAPADTPAQPTAASNSTNPTSSDLLTCSGCGNGTGTSTYLVFVLGWGAVRRWRRR